jgi:glutathione S-transferase
MGKVPTVLLENVDILSESGAILYYFAYGTELWPGERRAQAEVLRWMFFEQYSHEPALAVMRYLRRFTPDPRQHEPRAWELEPRGRDALAVMEARLDTRKWLAAEHCTIADYALYPYTRLSHEAGIDLDAYPATEAWLGRVECEPNFIAIGEDGAVETSTFEEYFDTRR